LDMSEVNSSPERQGLTPRQARHVRIVLSAIIMIAVGLTLVLRLGSTHSVLTMGFYGIALILSGSALVLSWQGRTRVATAVLGTCVALAVAAEWAVSSLR
jgi:urea transporter